VCGAMDVALRSAVTKIDGHDVFSFAGSTEYLLNSLAIT
jgi:hypothetical protein